MAYAARLQPGAGVHSDNRLAGLGYAIPGAVIADRNPGAGGEADNAIDAWFAHILMSVTSTLTAA